MMNESKMRKTLGMIPWKLYVSLLQFLLNSFPAIMRAIQLD